jgi:excisionase family DNA binding protein
MLTPISRAAQELSVSQRFLRQLIAQDRIPFYRLSSRTLRVDLEELRQCMKRMAADGQPQAQKEST